MLRRLNMRNRVAHRITAFRESRQGNVAFLFALTIVPILGFVGAAIDYTRANNARTAMQAALDSTALMLSRDNAAGDMTADEVTAKARTYFNALFHDPNTSGVNIAASYANDPGKGSTIQISGSGSVPTEFLKIVGFPQIDFTTSSATTWGMTKLRVALALDNTGSMSSDGKMAALQTAAKNLIDQLRATARSPGDVYISIIPFATNVNVGPASYNASWLTGWTGSSTASPPGWEAEPAFLASSKPSSWSRTGPGSSCPLTSPTYAKCASSPPADANNITTTIPSSGTYRGYICPALDPARWTYTTTPPANYNGCYTTTGSSPNYVHSWVPNDHSTWNGCVSDRDQPYDTTNAAPASAATSFYVEQATSCPVALAPLSYDWTSLKSTIDAMKPVGATNQPIGLAWAWHSLSQNAPLNAPAESTNFSYKKAIILLSDGLNTKNRWYGDGASYSSSVDDRQKLLCDNVKAAGITIYTIQVNTTSDPTSSVLQYCASGSQNFFMLTSANQVISTFNQIGTALSKLRVSH